MPVGGGGEQGCGGIAHQRAVIFGDAAGLLKPVKIRIPLPRPFRQRLIAVQVVQIAAPAGDGTACDIGVDGSFRSYGDQGQHGEQPQTGASRAGADGFLSFRNRSSRIAVPQNGPGRYGTQSAVEVEEHAVQAEEQGRQEEGFRPVRFLVRHQLFKQEHKSERKAEAAAQRL